MDEILKWQRTFKGKTGRGFKAECINNGFWLQSAPLNALLLLFPRLFLLFLLSDFHRPGCPCTTSLADDSHTAASRELPSTGEHGFWQLPWRVSLHMWRFDHWQVGRISHKATDTLRLSSQTAGQGHWVYAAEVALKWKEKHAAPAASAEMHRRRVVA